MPIFVFVTLYLVLDVQGAPGLFSTPIGRILSATCIILVSSHAYLLYRFSAQAIRDARAGTSDPNLVGRLFFKLGCCAFVLGFPAIIILMLGPILLRVLHDMA